MSASDKEEYERRGLSQIEWEMVLDSRMPMSKLNELQESGISVSEYFRYPWLNYGISESGWIQSRKSGLLESDISNENKPADRSDGRKIVSAFLMPGYHQFRQKQYWKGAIMTSVSVATAAIITAGSINRKEFAFGPLVVLVPVMLWSSLDIGLQLNVERNPEAQRFTGTNNNGSYSISLSILTR
jgi:hypothetical protein